MRASQCLEIRVGVPDVLVNFISLMSYVTVPRIFKWVQLQPNVKRLSLRQMFYLGPAQLQEVVTAGHVLPGPSTTSRSCHCAICFTWFQPSLKRLSLRVMVYLGPAQLQEIVTAPDVLPGSSPASRGSAGWRERRPGTANRRRRCNITLLSFLLLVSDSNSGRQTEKKEE